MGRDGARRALNTRSEIGIPQVALVDNHIHI
jgi:hypothetical protein